MPPAARVTDVHVCPMVTPGVPPVPHVGGPVIVGEPTVLTGNLFQARMADNATCVGPPDVIVRGSLTVIVGGKPAARLGDMTAHGGSIVTGCPTVDIGDGAAGSPDFPYQIVFNPDGTISFGTSITIEGDAEFQARCLADMMILASIPSGQALLNDIEGSGNSVTIAECGPGNDGASDGPWNSPNLTNGTGMDARVEYNPNQTPMYGNGSDWDNPPTAATLGHELTHASHITNGTLPGDPTTGPSVPNDASSGLPMTRAQEERRTVGAGPSATHGLPDYSAEPYSENAVRRDLVEPERTTYLNPDDGLW